MTATLCWGQAPHLHILTLSCAGLDARAAAIVMRCVRNTVNTGRTVVCTIHQPSIDIFEAFDDLLLMKSGGYVTYHGSLGKHSSKLIAYFEVSLKCIQLQSLPCKICHAVLTDGHLDVHCSGAKCQLPRTVCPAVSATVLLCCILNSASSSWHSGTLLPAVLQLFAEQQLRCR